MTTGSNFIIRDGILDDIESCLALDLHYETEYVWQMRVDHDTSQTQVTFNTERLPRALETIYPAEEKRLRLALMNEHCFLVAVIGVEEPEIVGYLAMRQEFVFNIAHIHDIVVSRPYRGQRIGTRLLKVARRWAEEKSLKQILLEIQTQNYPAIQFCQNRGFTFCGYNDQYFPNQDIALFFGQSIR